jgi:hypothetical protein
MQLIDSGKFVKNLRNSLIFRRLRKLFVFQHLSKNSQKLTTKQLIFNVLYLSKKIESLIVKNLLSIK